jgi:hypothetical protein
MNMANLALVFVIGSIIYAMIVFSISLGSPRPRLMLTRINLYGMFFCAVSLLAIIGTLFDGSKQYFLVIVGSLLMMLIGFGHTALYLANRPQSKEEARRLAKL